MAPRTASAIEEDGSIRLRDPLGGALLIEQSERKHLRSFRMAGDLFLFIAHIEETAFCLLKHHIIVLTKADLLIGILHLHPPFSSADSIPVSSVLSIIQPRQKHLLKEPLTTN